jgi:hypothetical protein
MPLLGREGIIEFQRRFPYPRIVPASALEKTQNRFTLDSVEFWTGDFARVIGKVGTSTETKSGFIYRDALNRISLHSNLSGAVNNLSSTRISFSTWDQAFLLISIDPHPCQLQALTSQYRTLANDLTVNLTKETSLETWPERLEQFVANGPEFMPWKVQGEIRSWQLSLSGAAVDVSGLGSVFSESVKAAISGSGTMDFLIDLYGSGQSQDSLTMLRLVSIIDNTSTLNAKFYLKKKDDEVLPYRIDRDMTYLSDALYYNAKILITQSSIDTAADGLVVGSADFVTTGQVNLGSDLERDKTYTCVAGDRPLYDAWMYPNPVGAAVIGASPLAMTMNEDNSLYIALGNTNNREPIVAKYTDALYPAWCKQFTCNDDNHYFVLYPSTPGHSLVALDNDRNPWIAAPTNNHQLTANCKIQVAKLNKNTGEIEFAFSFAFGTANTFDNRLMSYAIDDFGNHYFGVSQVNIGTSPRLGIIKMSPSGDLVWFKCPNYGHTPTNYDFRIYNNRLYIYDTFYTSGSSTRPSMLVVNLDGESINLAKSFRAVQKYTDAAVNGVVGVRDIAFDNAGNLYFASTVFNHDFYGLLVFTKLDTNLNPVWNYHYSLLGGSLEGGYAGYLYRNGRGGTMLDSQDRVFTVVGSATELDVGPGYIVEFNTNGDGLLTRQYSGIGGRSGFANLYQFRWNSSALAKTRSKNQDRLPLIASDRGVIMATKDGQIGNYISQNNVAGGNGKATLSVVSAVPTRSGPMPFQSIDKSAAEASLIDYETTFELSSEVLTAFNQSAPGIASPIIIDN